MRTFNQGDFSETDLQAGINLNYEKLIKSIVSAIQRDIACRCFPERFYPLLKPAFIEMRM